MTDDRTIKERLTAVEVTLGIMDEKVDEIVSSVQNLEALQRQQNGMLSESLGKIRKHLKDHEEDSNYWTVQQYIAEKPIRSIIVCVCGALTLFAMLVLSNETVIGELLEFLKMAF